MTEITWKDIVFVSMSAQSKPARESDPYAKAAAEELMPRFRGDDLDDAFFATWVGTLSLVSRQQFNALRAWAEGEPAPGFEPFQRSAVPLDVTHLLRTLQLVAALSMRPVHKS